MIFLKSNLICNIRVPLLINSAAVFFYIAHIWISDKNNEFSKKEI